MSPTPTDTTIKPQILVVVHQEQSTAGRIGHVLESLGFALDFRRPRFGDPLPATLADHAGAIIFGGPMSSNDNDDYVRREIDWINVPLRENRPYLGVCLGAQMLARHLGQRVYKTDADHAEIGYYPVQPTPLGASLCEAPFPRTVYQWHREGFELPDGAQLLASGETFHVQACRYGDNAYGLQFHPEVTYAMICRWTVRAAERMHGLGAQEPQSHRDGWFQHDPEMDRWMREFLAKWSGAASPLSR